LSCRLGCIVGTDKEFTMIGTEGQKGFTLLETLVAILILSAGMLGVGAMVNTSLKSDAYNRRSQSAESVVLDQMEALKAKIADTDITSGNACHPATDPIFYYKWTVTDADSDPNESRTKIEIDAGWPVGKGACTDQAKPEDCRHTLKSVQYIVPK
jgi:prepilin-type N-terminal cleavage/methylation domain-containing protein